MKDHFQFSINFVLDNEGCDYVVDSGGPTRYGITLSTLRGETDPVHGFHWGDLDRDGDIDADDVKKLSREQAMTIYRKQWWDRYGYQRIAGFRLAAKVLDMAVNMGPVRSHILLQRAINALTGKFILQEDGILGEKTIATANQQNEITLIPLLCESAWETYQKILKKPKYQKYKNGWWRRAFLLPGGAS